MASILPQSTKDIWLIGTDGRAYNNYKNNQTPLSELTLLGQWIYESCPDYQDVHPTDADLGFPMK
jgi:hypothetical protein